MEKFLQRVGTVEFLVDKMKKFILWKLIQEQVEHTITEEFTELILYDPKSAFLMENL